MTQVAKRTMSLLFGLALVLGLGFTQGMVQKAYAEDGDVGIGSIWYVGDNFNPNGKSFWIAGDYHGYLSQTNTYTLKNEDHKIQEPYWGTSDGWSGWVFKEMAIRDYDGHWCGLLLVRTDQSRKPVGLRIDEISHGAFSFGPVYDYHKHGDTQFRVWTGSSSLPKSAGSWFLDRDITLSEAWNVPDGTTNLCLNGHKITFSGTSGSAFNVGLNATLNLYDEGEGAGTITGFKSTDGGAVYVNGGAFTMNGGTISQNSAHNGGGVYVQKGTFTMNGGTINGNIADSGNGGGVFVGDFGIFTMNGGTVSGNQAQAGVGGGVHVKGSFELAGGKVTGNTGASRAASNVYLISGQTIDVQDNVASGTAAGVSMQTPGTFANYDDSAQAAIVFTSDDADYSIKKKTGALALEHIVHHFSYSASDSTITATCPCGETATLSIAAPACTVYGDGKSTVATITDNSGIRGDAKVQYQTKSEGAWGQATETAPVGAGDHRASITLGSATVSVEYAIAKAACPAVVTGTAAVKRGEELNLADNVRLNDATGAVTYAIDGEAGGCTLDGSKLKTSGSTAASVTVNVSVAADANYEALAATPIVVTITEKKTQTINAADVDAIFGATEIKLNASVAGEGTLSYAVKSGSEDIIGVDATGELTVKKAGTAYVTITAGETTEYAKATKDVRVTIAKASITPAVTLTGWTYGAAANTPSVSGNPGNGAVTYEYKAKDADDNVYAATVPTQAGTYTVLATVAETDNHEGASCTADFTVAKKAVNAVVYAEDKVYDGTTGTDAYAAVLEGLVGDDYMVAWAPGNFVDANAGENKVVNVEERDVVYYIKGESNYDVTFPDEITATIEKRPAVITAGEFTKAYGQADPKFAATVSNAVLGETLSYTLKRVDGEEAGGYPIIVTPGSNPNYEVKCVDGMLTITDADLASAQITVSQDGLAYTGQALTPAPTVKLGDVTLKEGTDYTVSYANNVNAGTATVTVTGKGGYTGTASAKFEIAKAANGLKAEGKTVKLKAKKLAKKAQKLKASKLAKVTKATGKVTYKLSKVKKSKFKKYFKLANTGKLTVKKKLKKGTYTLKVKVTAAGDANHSPATQTITVKVKVK